VVDAALEFHTDSIIPAVSKDTLPGWAPPNVCEPCAGLRHETWRETGAFERVVAATSEIECLTIRLSLSNSVIKNERREATAMHFASSSASA
jgi:hypothetical protein